MFRDIRALPLKAQQLVADFVAFLQFRYAQTSIHHTDALPPLADEPFFGMWNDRSDMADSYAWIRSMRTREWER